MVEGLVKMLVFVVDGDMQQRKELHARRRQGFAGGVGASRSVLFWVCGFAFALLGKGALRGFARGEPSFSRKSAQKRGCCC
jgi:hypothetical protein